MKRCFSIALVVALLGTTSVSPALSEGVDVVGEAAEASVVEVGAISDFAWGFGDENPAESFDGYLDEPADPEADEGEDLPESEDSESQTDDGKDLPKEGDPEPETDDDEDFPGEEDENLPEEEDDSETGDDEELSEGDGSDLTMEEEFTDEEISSETAKSATDFQLNAASISIGLNEKYTGLRVVALTENASLPTITWRSANKKVVTVNASSGAITGIKSGSSTTVYAKLGDSGIELPCKVSVKDAPDSVSVSSTSLTLSAGMTASLKASLPKGTASGKMTWSSNKASVATVDANGTICAVGPGTATIKIKTFNKKTASCKVKVVAAPASIAFPDSIVPMAVGQTTSVSAMALSSDGTEVPAIITYAIDQNSSDPGCVSLDEATGELTGLRKGQAVLCATTHNGKVARCQLEVDVAPKAIELNVSSITIGAKEVYVDIIAEFLPPDGSKTCAQIVKWTTDNKKVAQVDVNTGAITGVAKGSAVITATTPNGKTAVCKVKVLKEPTSVSISPAVGALKVGEKGQYKVTLPSGCGGSLTYESSDTKIAAIDSSGIVTAIAPGTVQITVTTYNGKTKTAELQVSGDSESESDGSKSGNSEKIQYLLSIAQNKLDCPYVYGSFGPNSFDCSGFVYWCYKQLNIKLKDSAYRQGYDDTYAKISYGSLIPGDVVFFNTVEDKDLSDHAGIYLGNGKFIHASSSAKKVIISKLTSGYYQRNFSWGRRIFK